MHEDQTRINATISYFFLGPLFLLARAGSPLAESYVHSHAKRASIIMLLGGIVYGIYFVVFQSLLTAPIF